MKKVHLGLFCHGSHDSAVAVVSATGEVLFAAEQERYDRIKHSAHFPREALQSAFDELEITWADVATVSFAWDPFADPHRLLGFLLRNAASSARFLFQPKQNTVSRIKRWRQMRALRATLASRGYKGKLRYFNHHLCHAASAYFTSGFESALCLTVDGNGEFASTTAHLAFRGRFRALFRRDYPQSLGHFYSSVTQYLGFKPMNDEYKVMGLGAFAHGSDCSAEHAGLARILEVGEKNAYRLAPSFFQFFRGRDQMWTNRFEAELGPAREPGAAILPLHERIALAAQRRLEEALLALSRTCSALAPGERYLCLAGGVALNCVANERLTRAAGWENVFIPPAPHDSGAALGAAYLAFSGENPGARTPALRSIANSNRF